MPLAPLHIPSQSSHPGSLDGRRVSDAVFPPFILKNLNLYVPMRVCVQKTTIKLLLSFHHVGVKAQTQVIGLGGRAGTFTGRATLL